MKTSDILTMLILMLVALATGLLLAAAAYAAGPAVMSAALRDACLAGATDEVRALAAAGEDLNARDPISGDTCLKTAITMNHVVLKEYLLGSPQVDLTNIDRQANPALVLLAAGSGNLSDIQYVVEMRRADIRRKRPSDGLTACLAAAARGRSVVLGYLHGRDPSCVKDWDDDGKNALSHALSSGDKKTIAMVRTWVNCDATDPRTGRTAVHAAAGSPFQTETLAALIEIGCNPDTPDKHGVRPVMVAAASGLAENYAILKAAHVSMSAEDEFGAGLAHYAATAEHVQFLATVLPDRAIDLDARDNNGTSALVQALWDGKTETALFLLSVHADPSVTDNAGRTVLMVALEVGNEKVAEAILKTGKAKTHQTDDRGRTAASIAAERAMFDWVYLLNPAARKYAHGYSHLIEYPTPESVRELAQDIGIDATLQDGTTALFHAALKGDFDTVLAALAAGADPNKKARSGLTPGWAARLDPGLVALLEFYGGERWRPYTSGPHYANEP